MSRTPEFLWYVPNEVSPGHRGDSTVVDHNSLEVLTSHARALEEHGWTGALIGTPAGAGRTPLPSPLLLPPRTTSFEPLIAIRPGYWRPANFASAAATLDHLTGGRVRINIVSGKDNLAAYGDSEGDQAHRYGRTPGVHAAGPSACGPRRTSPSRATISASRRSTVRPRIQVRGERRHPRLYFGGASEAAERVAAAEADVQLFWGEPLDGVAERIERLKALSKTLDRDLPPLEFGLRITTFVRDTTAEAWTEAEAKVAQMAEGKGAGWLDQHRATAVGAAAAVRPAGQGRRARRQPLYRSRQIRRRGRRYPPGWWDRPKTWRARCANTRISASPSSCCRTRPIWPRSSGRATSCCPCCAVE